MSDKTVMERLQIKPGNVVLIDTSHVAGVSTSLFGAFPDDVSITSHPSSADVGIVFVKTLEDVEDVFGGDQARAWSSRPVWVCYPKGMKAGSEVNRDILHDHIRQYGFMPNRHISIDDTWSALRFRALIA